MKKTIYTCLSALILLAFCSPKASAQITFTYNNMGGCFPGGDSMLVYTTGYPTGGSLEVYFGDGTSTNLSPYYTSGTGTAYFGLLHQYATSGSYTIKFVMLSSTGARLDSAYYTNTSALCQNMQISFYHDIAGTCVYNGTTDNVFYFDPPTIQIDSAGHPIDTIVGTYGIYYSPAATAPNGTIYTFKVIANPYGFLPCGIADSVNDTLNYSGYAQKYIGFICDPSVTAVDNAVYANATDVAVHNAWQYAQVTTTSCTAIPLTLTVTFSPKYSVATVGTSYGSGATYSVAGNVLTINYPSVSLTTPVGMDVTYNAVGTLSLGDTIHTTFQVTPISGDANPANNTENFIDTIRSSFDPNDKSVQPEGNITAGTKLQYMITFENTGNDTAHNIQVFDTLSDNVDIKSIKQIAASAAVVTSTFTYSGHNVVEFSFPGINLLDSSHHGQCTGFVAFTVNSKTGLATGTKIDNKAGIYFDDNAVVMTNNVENIIGIPSSVATMTNTANVQVYPNPVTDVLTIQLDNGSYSKLTITNIMGQVVMGQEFSGTKTIINVKTLPAGVYYVTLRGDSGVKVQKFEKM